MSHFTVLVIGEDVKKQLAPYHEFECTGYDDEFVKDIDITEEARQELESRTVSKIRDQDGNLHDAYDGQFYREPTKEEAKEIGIGGTGCNSKITWSSQNWKDGKGYRPKVHFCPEGWEKVKVKDTSTLSEFAESWYGLKKTTILTLDKEKEHKYGYILVDEEDEIIQIIKRTNPNAKWDYWRVGGRWAGMFKLKPNASKYSEPNYGWEFKQERIPKNDTPHTDQALKKDIDFEGMRNDAAAAAAQTYDHIHSLVNFNQEFTIWDNIDKEDINKAREAYHNQKLVLEWKKAAQNVGKEAAEIKDVLMWGQPDEYACSREEFINRAKNNVCRTFALVKEGRWYEKGKMGWWAMVSSEKDAETWDSIFWNAVNAAPDDTLLTVVDCHI